MVVAESGGDAWSGQIGRRRLVWGKAVALRSYRHNARWEARSQSRRYALNDRKAPSPRRTMAPAIIAPMFWPNPPAIAANPVGNSIRARPLKNVGSHCDKGEADEAGDRFRGIHPIGLRSGHTNLLLSRELRSADFSSARRSSVRWFVKAWAARLLVRPPASTALSFIEPKSESSSTRTRPPLPIPATAAAIAPRFRRFLLAPFDDQGYLSL
jgi:hypothetical protein